MQETVPYVVELMETWSPLQSNNGIGVKPGWFDAISHIGKDLCARRVKDFGGSRDVQMQATIVNNPKLSVVKCAGLLRSVHDVFVLETFWWRDEMSIECKCCSRMVQEVSEGF